MSAIAVTLASMLAGSCSDVSAPAREDQGFRLRWLTARQLSSATLVTGPGYLEITGNLSVPCSAGDVIGAAGLGGPDGREIDVYLVAQRSASDCVPPAPASRRFAARVGRLRPGTYAVRVVHQWADPARAPVPVFSDPAVIVP